MITIKEYAQQKKISMKAARCRLDRQVKAGVMAKKRGPSNLHLYYEVTPMNFRWHDPFNLGERRTT
jgi:hypothetical protein